MAWQKTDQMLAIKLEHDIEEVIQVSTLDHLSMNDIVLLFDPVFRRLNHSCVVKLIEVEFDSL